MTRRKAVSRDQDRTPFAETLELLCKDSGALCAALVDGEGETVDYGGSGDPFGIRILAAELRLLQQHMSEAPHLAGTFEFVVRARRRSFLLASLPEGYALTVELPRHASGISDRALSAAIRGVCQEAGFDAPTHDGPVWRSVSIEEEGRGSCRPRQITLDGETWGLEILGRLAGESVQRRERGYRVRLQNGHERNVIREALGHWFLEED